jgi:hypothetical protein
MYDSKCLSNILDDFLEKNVGITTFLADFGFYTSYIIEVLKKHAVKPLIAKNVRNSKKHKRPINKKVKKVKLTYAQKIERQLEDLTKKRKNYSKKEVR